MWQGARKRRDLNVDPSQGAFRRGFLVKLRNPKSVPFAAAVLVAVFPAGTGGLEKALVVANHLVVELAFYTVLAFGFGSVSVSRGYLRLSAWTDRIAAAILAAPGLRRLVPRQIALQNWPSGNQARTVGTCSDRSTLFRTSRSIVINCCFSASGKSKSAASIHRLWAEAIRRNRASPAAVI